MTVLGACGFLVVAFVAWFMIQFIVWPKAVYQQTEAFCERLPPGTTAEAFTVLWAEHDMVVVGKDWSRGEGEQLLISGGRIEGFCYISCRARFSRAGRLISAEAGGFCD